MRFDCRVRLLMIRFFICIFLFVIAVTGCPATANADQNDPRLDKLFADLQTPLSATAAQKIENQIWQYWLSFPDDQTIENPMPAAMLMMERGRLQSAERIFGHIIDREPHFAEAWNKRATVRFWLVITMVQPRILPKSCNLNPGILAPYQGLA